MDLLGKFFRTLPSAINVTSLIQLMAAFACFLGAFVVPLNYPHLGSETGIILAVIGTGFLLACICNVLFADRIRRRLKLRRRSARVVLPREGLVYLGIMLVMAVGGVLGNHNMLLLVFGMMAGPFVVNGWIVYGMLQKTKVRRDLPPYVAAGEVLQVALTVRNDKRLMASRLIRVEDRIRGNGEDVAGNVTFVRIPAGQERTGCYDIRFGQRGLYEFGPLRISSTFPLGIGERGEALEESHLLLVHPMMGTLKSLRSHEDREMAESRHRSQLDAGLFDDEFHRIREFRTGDNMRLLHWKSTARRGELMVREYHQNRRAAFGVLLDFVQSEDPQFDETLVSFAATVCTEQTRAAAGSRFFLGIAGAEQQSTEGQIAGHFRLAALDELARCRPAPEPDLRELLTRVRNSCTSGDERFLLITGRADEARTLVMDLAMDSEFHWPEVASRIRIIETTPTTISDLFEAPGQIRLSESQELSPVRPLQQEAIEPPG